MALTAAEQVAQDIAEFLAADEKPHHEWLSVLPAGAEELIAGYEVLPHVQRFADAVRAATGVRSIGTYPGHSPSIDRALDLFHVIGDTRLANAICDFAIAAAALAEAHPDVYAVRYVISRQRIWHRLDPVWRWMEDRGSPTQNHMDHVHTAHEATAPALPPEPKPDPEPPRPVQEDDGMKLIAVTEDRGIFLAGENVGEDGKVPARHVGTPDEVAALVESGAVANYDKRPALPASVFDAYYRVVG